MMREEPFDLSSPDYTPAKLLSETAAMLHAPNDAKLALVLEIDQSMLTRIRKRKIPVSAYLMVQIMDRTGWHITEVRRLAGMPYDGVAKLVVLAQRIGFRYPGMYTQRPDYLEWERQAICN